MKRRQNNTERVDVQLPTELRRLVGYRAQELITKSGRYVRDHAPLNVEKWSDIPTDIVDKIINIIYRTHLMRQIEQHNEKRATFADQKRENDDYSYDISLDEDFVTALEYGIPPASGMSPNEIELPL
ncbi:hypothetical protein KSP39_PZI007931 [Platanthera zijinensis]|uniref:Uncharacterized protein n=1 Tax=Platanthera zijinensis TaxID=2320716 RepID=A0AAP0G850_9ASPA